MKRVEHREEKWVFPFVEYSPENIREGMPLIIQLHGAGERGDGGESLKLVDVHGFYHVIKDEEYDCIFIMPQCPEESFWAARVESIIKFIEQLKKEYKVDEDRVYLTGLSMGGYGTWYTAMARPDLFAAIAPVCGGGMAWNAHTLKMPVWTFHGMDDTTVSPIQTEEMVKAIENCGGDVRFSKFEGVGHAVQTYAYTNELIEWFLSKKRQG